MACPLLLPCSGVARGWTPRGSSSLVCSQNCLDVRAHDLVYPAYAGELHQLVHTKIRSTLVQFEGFDRHIQSNLISEFETVCNSLGGRVDPDSDTVELADFNPFTESLARELENAEWWMVDSRLLGTPGQCDVDLVRNLRRQLMERECRYQADHPPWDSKPNYREVRIR